MNYLFDTNAIIYLLAGKSKSFTLTKKDNIFISFITKIELLSYETTANEVKKIKQLINYYDILFINDDLINKTIQIRKKHGLKLPDSIIVATAINKNAILVTSDNAIIKRANDMKLKIMNPLVND